MAREKSIHPGIGMPNDVTASDAVIVDLPPTFRYPILRLHHLLFATRFSPVPAVLEFPSPKLLPAYP